MSNTAANPLDIERAGGAFSLIKRVDPARIVFPCRLALCRECGPIVLAFERRELRLRTGDVALRRRRISAELNESRLGLMMRLLGTLVLANCMLFGFVR